MQYTQQTRLWLGLYACTGEQWGVRPTPAYATAQAVLDPGTQRYAVLRTHLLSSPLPASRKWRSIGSSPTTHWPSQLSHNKDYHNLLLASSQNKFLPLSGKARNREGTVLQRGVFSAQCLWRLLLALCSLRATACSDLCPKSQSCPTAYFSTQGMSTDPLSWVLSCWIEC